MDQYSFVITFVSIILGVAIAKSLEAIGKPLKRGTQSDFYPLHAMAGSLLVLLIVQYWWGIFDERSIENWTFLNFLQFVLTPILFYFTAEVFSPGNDGQDTRTYYWRHIRTGLLVMALLFVNNIMTDLLWPEISGDIIAQAIRGTAILVLAGMAISRSEKLHYAGYIFFYLAFAAFVLTSP
ncbi:MAG: hypothetical protein ACPG06_02110 [Alphaproteobacteria bacterium]